MALPDLWPKGGMEAVIPGQKVALNIELRWVSCEPRRIEENRGELRPGLELRPLSLEFSLYKYSRTVVWRERAPSAFAINAMLTSLCPGRRSHEMAIRSL